jgi:hypothetical protein
MSSDLVAIENRLWSRWSVSLTLTGRANMGIALTA